MKESKSVIKDPACGMTVDPATALHAERGGETPYFCSERCRAKFGHMRIAGAVDSGAPATFLP
jgi:YHS domain-containing protein